MMRYGAYYGADTIVDDLWRDEPLAGRDAADDRGTTVDTVGAARTRIRPVTRIDAGAPAPAVGLTGILPAPVTASAGLRSAGVTVSLTTVNWLVLMALLCTFLLAQTVPAADTALTDGGSSGATTQAERADSR